MSVQAPATWQLSLSARRRGGCVSARRSSDVTGTPASLLLDGDTDACIDMFSELRERYVRKALAHGLKSSFVARVDGRGPTHGLLCVTRSRVRPWVLFRHLPIMKDR
jgi:hypothetical protein